MKDPLGTSRLPRSACWRAIAATGVISLSCLLAAQAPHSDSAATNRDAMRKLAFLAGHWTGPVKIIRGPGEPLQLTQTEDVEYKLDGLVLLIEGKSTGAEGKVAFQALATVAFDDAAHAYRFHAYHDGHYVDTELTLLPDGFSWGFDSGPAHVVNTMHLTGKGEWREATEVIMGDNPPLNSVEMLLARQP
jgi:hypothetical protein